MRLVVLSVVSAIVGGLVGALLIFVAFYDGSGLGFPTRGGAAAPQESVTGPALDRRPPTTASTRSLASRASRLAAAGRWREAQEAYLAVLLIDRGNEEAMRGLVRAMRALAKDDPAVLRRQIAAYRRALASGLETDEHYTAAAMEILVRAGDRALRQIGSAARPTSPPPRRQAARSSSPPPEQPAAARNPRPSAAAEPPPSAARPPQPPPPAKPPQFPPPPATPPRAEAPLDPTEPFLILTVGPVDSAERAAMIAAELTMEGFSARAQRHGGGRYVIVVGPYRATQANRAAAYVRSRFGRQAPVTLSPVPDDGGP